MIRELRQEEYSTVNEWFIEKYKQELPFPILPALAFCDIDLTAACWIETGQSTPAAWIMFLTANPRAEAKKVALAISHLLEASEQICLKLGKFFMFTTSNNLSYTKFLKSKDWEAGHDITQLSKVLCHKQ